MNQVTNDYPPIQCLLELRYDGTVSVVARHGCTDTEIRDLLGQLTNGMWTGEPVDGATARSEDAA